MNLENRPQVNKEQPKDVNMYLHGLGNASISTDYAQNPPRTLAQHYDQSEAILIQSNT